MTNRTEKRWRGLAALSLFATAAAAALVVLPAGEAAGLDPRLKEMEKKRIAAIEKVQPAVVAVMTGGGSGVLISDDGYALTNFHVVAAARGPFMKCGLPDGVLYDAVLVGLDKVGDVALIKLYPKEEGGKVVAPKGGKFPFAKMGDSDKVQAGDWSLAMGNPFLLATDFTPTVTFGLISGVHRYQYPAGTLLEYTDCIQIDTSINPGNSGGPLFNMDGELIGINGRGSFEKRGRVNSGVGYAISINQIKNFLGPMRAGLDTDHASLGAQVGLENEDDAINKIVVKSIIESDAARRGMEVGDQLVSFAGRPMSSPNQFKNVLGLFPRGWRVPLTFRHEGNTKSILVRLMGVQRQELIERSGGAPAPGPGPGPRPGPGPKPVTPPKLAGKYEAKQGFANHYFNKAEQKQLLDDFHKHGDFKTKAGTWEFATTGFLYSDGKSRRIEARIEIKDKGAKDGKNDLITAVIDGIDYSLEPLKDSVKTEELMDPPGSGGLLLALYQYRLLLAFGPKAFTGGFSHGGTEPFYVPDAEGNLDARKIGPLAEVLRTRYAGVSAKWYFEPKEGPDRGRLLGFEMEVDRDKDPCEVYFSNYKAVDGRQLPHRIVVRHGNGTYAVLTVNSLKMVASK